MMEDYLQEDDERIGQETDAWMDVKESAEFIDMSGSPGDIVVRMTGKPTLQRSKFGGRPQYWFPCEQIVDLEKGTWAPRILSTGSTKLRRALKRVVEKEGHDEVFGGHVPIGISWAGENMDRSYTANRVVIPSGQSQ